MEYLGGGSALDLVSLFKSITNLKLIDLQDIVTVF